MPIALIVAVAGQRQVIGKDGDLPWHFSSDLKFFKEKTLGSTVLMGRVTFQSILKRLGKPLPGRENVVLTRDLTFTDERVRIIHSTENLTELVGANGWLFIIGGAAIYRETLPLANILYMTHIENEIDGDAFFPLLDAKSWSLVAEQEHVENGTTLRFCTYQKVPTN